MSNGLADFVTPKKTVTMPHVSNGLVQKKLLELVELYEFMRKWQKQKLNTMGFVAAQAMRDGVTTIRNEQGFLIAAAFFWQVSDPYDASRAKTYPPHEPDGRYLFFSLFYVRKDHRGKIKLIRRLIKETHKRYPKTTRAAWVRTDNPKLVHVMNLRK